MTMYVLPFALVLGALLQPSAILFTGQLNDRLISESRMIGVELQPGTSIEIAGLAKDDKVYAATIEMFKQPSAPKD